MPQFTVRNSVLLALLQVGALVGGILAAGASQKLWHTHSAAPAPWVTYLVVNYGALALIAPLLWIAAMVRYGRSPEASEGGKALAFASGLALLTLILGVAVCAVIQPWVHAGWETRPVVETLERL